MLYKALTKARFRAFQSLHNNLETGLDWYFSWHHRPHHQLIHYSFLAAAVVGVMAISVATYIKTPIGNSPADQIAYHAPSQPVSGIPNQIGSARLAMMLFDIKLNLDSALVMKASDLVSRTQFTSFGTVPTPVNMVYRIEDASGAEVYTENGTVTVETEQIVTKEFTNLALNSGKYNLVLTTTYGANVQDEFRQAFEVRAAPADPAKTIWVILMLMLAAIGGFIVFLLMKRKKVIPPEPINQPDKNQPPTI